MLQGPASVWRCSRLLPLLKNCARCVSYVQGQSPSPKTREYFYYIDHQGQLFLDDARLKNFITCFKDKKFLAFFFRRIKKNSTGRYEEEFPYVSPCGPETNYVRCDDLPVVFTHLLDKTGQPIQDIQSYGQSLQSEDMDENVEESSSRIISSSRCSSSRTNMQNLDNSCTELLSYGGAGESLTVPFRPEMLCMLPESGRVYHAGPEKLDSVGLVKSSLAIELSRFFVYKDGSSDEASSPVGFQWRGTMWTIDGTTVRKLTELKMVEGDNKE